MLSPSSKILYRIEAKVNALWEKVNALWEKVNALWEKVNDFLVSGEG